MNNRMKWTFTFILLTVTLLWSTFTVVIVRGALEEPSVMGVLEASGTNALLGALIGWNTMVVQFWFRKKGPEV